MSDGLTHFSTFHTHNTLKIKKKTNSKMNNQYFARLASKPVKRKLSSQQDDRDREKDDEVVQAKKKKKKSSKWKGGRKRYVRTSTFEEHFFTYDRYTTDKMTRMMRNERKS